MKDLNPNPNKWEKDEVLRVIQFCRINGGFAELQPNIMYCKLLESEGIMMVIAPKGSFQHVWYFGLDGN